MKIQSSIKAGALSPNHNASGVRVQSRVKAGGLAPNHNASGLLAR